ncbi:MAG: hypothetical protein ACKOEM_19665, partial [Planctomycetia bacterium]
QDISQFPLYDQIDDDTINQYRRNIPYWDYGAIPGQPIPLGSPFIFGPQGKSTRVITPSAAGSAAG